MLKKSSMKAIPLAAAVTAALLFGGVAQAQGATPNSGPGGQSSTPAGTTKPQDSSVNPTPSAGGGTSGAGKSGGSTGSGMSGSGTAGTSGSGMSGSSSAGASGSGMSSGSSAGATPPGGIAGTTKPNDNITNPAPAAGTARTAEMRNNARAESKARKAKKAEKRHSKAMSSDSSTSGTKSGSTQ